MTLAQEPFCLAQLVGARAGYAHRAVTGTRDIWGTEGVLPIPERVAAQRQSGSGSYAAWAGDGVDLTPLSEAWLAVASAVWTSSPLWSRSISRSITVLFGQSLSF